jgi:hypothetical protein
MTFAEHLDSSSVSPGKWALKVVPQRADKSANVRPRSKIDEPTNTEDWAKVAGQVNAAKRVKRFYTSYGVSSFDLLQQNSTNASPLLQTAPENLRFLFGPSDKIGAMREATTVPGLLGSSWYRLFRSKLPDRVFRSLSVHFSAGWSLEAPKVVPSSAALDVFLRLWEHVGGASAEPVVSVSPKGDIVAEWFDDAENSLVAMAHRDRVLHYSLFDSGEPVEGWVGPDHLSDFVSMMTARAKNPFNWSDADEG